jgi:uncharacterized protein
LNLEQGIAVPMRDGVILQADLYRPSSGDRHPVLLQRTPYGKRVNNNALLMLDVARATVAGYAVVIQDTRGRGSSEGEFTPFFDEISDGYDTVEWCGTQPWSDGNVGMYGASYVGATQWLAAVAAPPHLRAIFPQITPAQYHEGWTYQGGALALGFVVSWTVAGLAPDTFRRLRRQHPELAEPFRRLVEGIDDLRTWFERLPVSGLAAVIEVAPYFKDWVDHPDDDDFWLPIRVQSQHQLVTVPACNVGGWYDPFLRGTIDNFAGMRERGATVASRQDQQLLIGPWGHTVPFNNVVGEVDFGVRSSPPSFDLDGIQLRWFDHWLKNQAKGVVEEPPVRFFVMGTNQWRTADDWPPPGTAIVPWYLHSDGRANSLRGSGSLSLQPPGDEAFDVYLSDPRHPVPTRGGGLCCWPAALPSGGFDQTPVEAREDVLVYTSDVLTEDLEVIGPVSVVLYLASSAPDSDLCAKLVDVHPNGFARNICDGILRARYRESRGQCQLMEPGRVYRLTVHIGDTANVFLAGHRIRVEVAGSNFPRFDRNPQTGDPAGSATMLEPALQRVYHDGLRASHLLLPTGNARRPNSV